ncbi:RimK family protein [Nitrosovibrio sp. Nv6]|uniref:RimK family protein n=1 Tax=Nitrosovibrio sp. Nv6 TaxID=1855340 RepID=UPI0008CDB800|nr:RimK family protein [Nitrosovibrio sp. Nv6]SEO67243.1 Glutathione synthase/RimK-type ligase, ATP-grasp superfamily [Nitrosovibrio sp. Nv6]
MNILIIVDEPEDWPLQIPDVTIVAAQTYLTDPAFAVDDTVDHAIGHGTNTDRGRNAMSRSVKLFNLCKSYHYQGSGYYVSLLAEARGHKPLPKVGAIEDLQSWNLVRHLTEDMNDLIQRKLSPLPADSLELGVYFGRDTAGYHPLSHQLFNLLQVPLLSARFERHRNRWSLRSVRAIGAGDIPSDHQEFAVRAATEYFTGRRQWSEKHPPRFDLAILHDPDNPEPPSNAKALQKFKKAAEELSMRVEFITRSDMRRLPQFDALFIRDTTFVNHYTYRFSRLATAERLVVIDDPDSILKCNNKVYLAELLAQHNLPTPKTLLVHRDNISRIVPELGLPCILKQPDSSFSRGVIKVETEAELIPRVTELLAKSVLIIAQEWLPTRFDWRVGILDRKVLFVAKYYFPAAHWQVIKRDEGRRKLSEGPTQAVPIDETPEEVIRIALESANLIGAGFYGVDIKQVGNRCSVIEVNDNPNVDAGNEDAVLKDVLYREVMGVFLKRIETHKQGNPR